MNTLLLPERLQKFLSVVDDGEVVVVHHEGQRLADDQRQPDDQVAAALTEAAQDVVRNVDQRDLEMRHKIILSPRVKWNLRGSF